MATDEFAVDDVPETALALLSMAVDVAHWYDPVIKRTPEAIGRAYGELGLRLVGAVTARVPTRRRRRTIAHPHTAGCHAYQRGP